MGIKFLCPNGHKLNVKSFLAGKKAICPKCGTRVVVPLQTEEAAGGDEPDTAGEGDSVDLSRLDVAAVLQPSIATEQAAADPATPSTAKPASVVDALTEAPNAVWYVRPATGGQFGPATAQIMSAWLSEGRVGASSLVWRAGWAEWRPAAATFPQLAGQLASPGIAVGPPQIVPTAFGDPSANGLPASLPLGQVVQSVAGVGPQAPDVVAPPAIHRRRRRNDISMLASVVLVLLSIILLIILFIVFRGQNAPEERTPEPTKPPAAATTEPKTTNE